MGIGFYKEEKTNDNNEDTFAVYSSYTDRFIYKNMTVKELVFFYIDQGSKVSELKNTFHYRMRDINLKERSESDQKSYKKAKRWSLKNYFIESVSFYVKPMMIEDNVFVIYDTFTDTVLEKTFSKDEAIEYLYKFYEEILSEKYITNALGMFSEEPYKNMIKHYTYDDDLKESIYNTINNLLKKNK